MKNALLPIFFVLPALVNGQAAACSCAKVEMGEVVEQSESIVVARVTDSAQSPAPGGAGGKYIVERASFVVIETIKGSKRIGDKIKTRSVIGPGACGISARNKPMWLEQVQPQSSDLSQPFPVSGTWLIFGHDKEPYELSFCSRSSPLNVRGSEDLEVLRNLLNQRER